MYFDNETEITCVEVYWDHDGYAERVTWEDGHQLSGPCEWMEPQDDLSDLPDAVSEVARAYGLEIRPGMVAVHREEGGYGIWTSDEA